jgi:hypothetical protein
LENPSPVPIAATMARGPVLVKFTGFAAPVLPGSPLFENIPVPAGRDADERLEQHLLRDVGLERDGIAVQRLSRALRVGFEKHDAIDSGCNDVLGAKMAGNVVQKSVASLVARPRRAASEIADISA